MVGFFWAALYIPGGPKKRTNFQIAIDHDLFKVEFSKKNHLVACSIVFNASNYQCHRCHGSTGSGFGSDTLEKSVNFSPRDNIRTLDAEFGFLLKNRTKIDDSLDAFGVHGLGGFVGAILTGVFAIEAIGGDGKKGLIDGNAGQVLTQLWGSLVTIAWCAVATFIILKIVDAMIGLRVTTEEEVEGLDINLHGETVH